MKVSTLINQLKYGELKHIKANEDVFTAAGNPALMVHFNAALTELHTRFQLRTEQLILQVNKDISTYILDASRSQSTGTADIKYILDEGDQFHDNILMIESITDENGCEVPLNVLNKEESWSTPIYNGLNVPFPTDDIYIVHYRADHPEIPLTTTPENIDVQIPASLTQCFCLFVAARVYESLPSLEGMNMGNKLSAKFEFACNKIKESAIIATDSHKNTNIEDDGWA